MNSSHRSSILPRSKKQVFLILPLLVLLVAGLSICLGAEKLNIFQAISDCLRGEQTTASRIFLYVRRGPGCRT